MAEFCLKCYNRIEQRGYDRGDLVLTWRKDLCEGCGDFRRLVARKRARHSPLRILCMFPKDKE